jgi:hypothetical protein
VLGIDDWAWRKGRCYGTILCDLERGKVIDLLPERSAESTEQWLRTHPGAEIISRDRASLYAEAATKAAPNAVQVADRWHLLHNMSQALQGVLVPHHRLLAEVALCAARGAQAAASPVAQQPTSIQLPSRKQRAQEQNRERRSLRKRGRVGVVAIKVANKVPKGAKTTPFGNRNPTEIPCFISGLRVAVKTAKPLCPGSIPAAPPILSDNFQQNRIPQCEDCEPVPCLGRGIQ